MTDKAIEITELRKSYGGRPVLDGVTLHVERGTLVALLGSNGAGKTTLISILATLVAPDEGTVVVEGADVERDPAGVRSRISLTGQSAAVDTILTGRQNLVMMARLAGFDRRAARERAAELLARFDLEQSADRAVRTYSGGMRRRLDLSLSLVTTPPVLFLDEPTTGLDTRSRQELWTVIRSLRDEGTTVLLTTQYLQEADELADRVAVLEGGRLVAEGTAAQLKARTGGEVVELRDARDRVVRERPTDGTIAGLRAAIDELDPGVPGMTITVRKPSLDDVFLRLTADPRDAVAA